MTMKMTVIMSKTKARSVQVNQMKSLKKEGESYKEYELTYQFQGQYSRSPYCFNIDPGWIKDNFMTRGTKFFKMLYLKHIPGQTNKYWFAFSVSIGTEKKTSQVQFYSDSPTLAYQKHDHNSSCFSSLASDF